jgi:hypothetical protein
MFRVRLATLAAAGLGLVCGCASMSNDSCSTSNGGIRGFFGRLCGRNRTTTTASVIDGGVLSASPCCNGDTCGLMGDGPLLLDRGPLVLPPGAVVPGPVPTAPLAPQSSLPLAPTPQRLVPQPQSQPQPYNP